MSVNTPILRPAYNMNPAKGLVEAANMLAAEADAEACTIRRPFNGLNMEAWPGVTGAQVALNWKYDLDGRRDRRWTATIESLQAEIAELKAEIARLRGEA